MLNLPLNHVKPTVISAINVNHQQKVLAVHATKDTVIPLIPVQYVLQVLINQAMIQHPLVQIAMQDTGAVREVIHLRNMHAMPVHIQMQAQQTVLHALREHIVLPPLVQVVQHALQVGIIPEQETPVAHLA